MPNEYKNCMVAVKDAQQADKRSIAFDGVLSDETIEKLKKDEYAVVSFTMKDRDKPSVKRTIIAWSKR